MRMLTNPEYTTGVNYTHYLVRGYYGGRRGAFRERGCFIIMVIATSLALFSLLHGREREPGIHRLQEHRNSPPGHAPLLIRCTILMAPLSKTIFLRPWLAQCHIILSG